MTYECKSLKCDEKLQTNKQTKLTWISSKMFCSVLFRCTDNSRAYIRRSRTAGQVSISCLKGCARNYRCRFGDYNLLDNNCHYFASRLSFVLCKVRKGYCPTWCLGSCNDATNYTTYGIRRPNLATLSYEIPFVIFLRLSFINKANCHVCKCCCFYFLQQ